MTLFIYFFKFYHLSLRSKGLSHAVRRKVDGQLDSPPPFFIACQLEHSRGQEYYFDDCPVTPRKVSVP